MRYRKLGRTNLNVSEIGVGGGAFYGVNKTTEQVKEVIDTAFKNGVNFIETAEDYNEAKIAPALKDKKDEIILASKSFSETKEEMEESIKKSLKKLETNHIEIYMLHTVNSIDGLNFRIKNGVLDALKEAKSEDKIGYVGITGHRIPVLIEAVKMNKFDVVEVPYCIGAFETEKLFKIAKEYEVGVIAIRPFGGGILVNPNKSFKKAEFMNPKNALAYVLSNKSVSTALVGMSCKEHVKENLKSLEAISNIGKVKKQEIERKVKNFLGQNFCRGCLACMPCAAHGWNFGIDDFLRMNIFYKKYNVKSIIEEYQKLDMNAGECIGCGECESKCPYNVPIIKNLKNVHESL